MTESGSSLVGQILIAMPNLADPNFWHSVVVVGVHSEEDGAFGLMINRPLDVDPDDILSSLGRDLTVARSPVVMFGGPVEPSHGFVIFDAEGETGDEHAVAVDRSIKVTGNADTLSGLVEGSIGGDFLLVLGYSGWAPGQLEREIEENSWLVAPLDRRIVFEVPPEDRWHAALRSIGVDPGTLVDLGSGAPS